MKLAVVGLGKLGSPFAALLAAKGNTVVGADMNEQFVECVSRGVAPIDETGLPALMTEAAPRLSATTSVAKAAADAEVVFIVVPTPSLPDGTFDVTSVVAAVREIGATVSQRHGGRLVVVVTSTVLPGATSGSIRAALEEAAGMAVGDELGLCYSPEFIALGSVIADMRAPDFILIGESSEWAGECVASVLQAMTDNSAPVRRMSLVDAEVSKIAVNTFVTTKISYANMLADICARLPGADASVVARAIGLDSRIGSKYLQPATPYGGPCFPRDNAALAALARGIGTSADIAEATDAINRRQVAELADRVLARADGGRIAILGLSYKPATGVADESFGVALARYLHANGNSAVVWDPQAIPAASRALGDEAVFAAGLEECLDSAAVVIVATAWPEFQRVPELMASPTGSVGSARCLVDCWRMFQELPSETDIEIWRPGVGSLTGD
jgi:UDPglucose 6-dehydrogenase